MALVSSLKVYSNTTIIGLTGCGFFQMANSNKPVLYNAHRDGSVVDDGITIVNLTINANGANQSLNEDGTNCQESDPATASGWVVGLMFSSASNVTLSHLYVHNSRTFATYFSCITNLTVDGLTGYQDQAWDIRDVFHLNGPAANIVGTNLWSNVNDDSVGLNIDENYGLHFPLAPWVTYGDVDNVLIDGLTCSNAHSGVRMITMIQRLDHVTIRNVHGTVGAWAVGASAYLEYGPGNLGSILIEDIDVTYRGEDWITDNNGPSPGFNVVSLNCHFDEAQINRLHSEHVTDGRPPIYVGADLYDDTDLAHATLWVDGVPAKVVNHLPVQVHVSIANCQATCGGGTLSIPSALGFNYQLQLSPALTPPVWTDAGAPQPGDNGCLTFTVTNAVTQFYRFRVSPIW